MTINALDVGVVIDFTVNKPDATPYDLTGATVTLLSGSFAAKACTITDAAAGKCRLTTVANECGSTSATYSSRLKIAASGGGVYHSSSFNVVVLA